MMSTLDQTFNKNKPFLASIKERYPLTKPGSQKSTFHITLDLADSNLTYSAGDCIGIYPINGPDIVQRTLKSMKASGMEQVFPRNEIETLSFHDFLSSKGNITEINPKLFKEVALRQTNPDKKLQLENFLLPENRDAFKAYTGAREVWDFLLENDEVSFTPQEYVDLLMPLLQRFYSIASSTKVVGSEVHLTVAHVKYDSLGHLRQGTCTHYLCHMAPMDLPIVPVFIQPAHTFRLPEDNTIPIIMIGPGTGVAPFRAFMQERVASGATGKHWLFFGECHQEHDYLYQEFWEDLANKGVLKVDTAFSRDQSHKVYVQHKMYANGAELYAWLEEGAYLFVCGDAKRMAKDVDAMLHQIIQEHGQKDEAATKLYMKKLRADKRYLRDVY
jgi:sulfite reductase (NADPH) flavoprotein alpha-component